jgi:hypothetical protein
MRAILISVSGVMHAPFSNAFTDKCVILPAELSDSMRDEVLRNYCDVFYVFTSGDPIVGEHHHTFEIYSFDVISEEEISAVC